MKEGLELLKSRQSNVRCVKNNLSALCIYPCRFQEAAAELRDLFFRGLGSLAPFLRVIPA